MTSTPHIAHIVFRLDFGGLENGLINIINELDEYNHTIISLTDATEFRDRLNREIPIYEMHKQPGKDIRAYGRLRRLLKTIRPDILHTRNIGTLDCQWVGAVSSPAKRVHGEHGWDSNDPDGKNLKNQVLRYFSALFVDRWVALSSELESFLYHNIHIPKRKIVRICNGVDLQKYRRQSPIRKKKQICFGTVTRFNEIKDPLNTIKAFSIVANQTSLPVRFLMVGDGPMLPSAKKLSAELGIDHQMEFVGRQMDITPYLNQMDVFVLGSKREGISNTILEAKASGIAIVATNVGGNSDLINHGVDGVLVPLENSHALAEACLEYVNDFDLRVTHARAGRQRAETEFSLSTMVSAYRNLYLELLT